MEDKKYRLVLLGPPGAGKGTQALLLSNQLSIPQISTGDILRDQISRKSELGLKAEKYSTQGLLVPDSIVVDLVKNRLLSNDCSNGYILDGFPRTVNQAKALEVNNIPVDHVILLEMPSVILIQRITGRRVCSVCNKMYHIKYNPPKVHGMCDTCKTPLTTRKDDGEDTVRKRLQVYSDQTTPLITFFRSYGPERFHRIDGGSNENETPEHIFNRVKGVLSIGDA